MVIFAIGIILILYSLFAFRSNKYKIEIGFLFCFLIMGFQSGVVGDFDNYKYSFENFKWNCVEYEKGEYFWVWLNYVFSRITSFHVFICCLCAVECYILKTYLRRFSGNSRYLFISAILFFFTFNYMLMQMKALRQGLAVEMSLLSLIYLDRIIENRKYLYYAILSSVAAYLSHHSSLILILLVWLFLLFNKSIRRTNRQTRDKKRTFIFPLMLSILALIVVAAKKMFLDDYLAPFLAQFSDERYDQYLIELVEKDVQSTLMVLYDLVIIFLFGWHSQYAIGKTKYITLVAIIGMYIDLLCFANDTVQRILLYFSIFNLAVFPNLIDKIDEKCGKSFAWLLIFFLMGYAFKTSFQFMTDPTLDRFGNYQFIFLSNL